MRNNSLEVHQLNSNHSLTQIQIYITIIIVGVQNTDSHYVDTIPVVQEQPYDQHDIAEILLKKECIWNKINLKDSDKLLIGCVYKSTSSDTNNYSKLSEMLHEIGKLEDKFSHVLVT
jgi:hypothetical protein